MEAVLVGSCAALQHGLTTLYSGDIDLICSKDIFSKIIRKLGENYMIVEIQPTSSGMAVAFRNPWKTFDNKYIIVEAEYTDDNPSGQIIYKEFKKHGIWIDFPIFGTPMTLALPSLNDLYLLKMSHRFKKNSPHFEKTRDSIMDMRKLGAYIEDEHLLAVREAATYNYSHPNLNQSKSEFFADDGVQYKYDHDSLHEAMKHLDQPAYMYYKEPGEEVKCSKTLFDIVDPEVRLYGVLEEAYVLALERAVIPCGTDPDKAFTIALQKVCTSVTSGWFREYAWEHYSEVMDLYHNDTEGYVWRFVQALQSGVVKPYVAG